MDKWTKELGNNAKLTIKSNFNPIKPSVEFTVETKLYEDKESSIKNTVCFSILVEINNDEILKKLDEALAKEYKKMQEAIRDVGDGALQTVGTVALLILAVLIIVGTLPEDGIAALIAAIVKLVQGILVAI